MVQWSKLVYLVYGNKDKHSFWTKRQSNISKWIDESCVCVCVWSMLMIPKLFGGSQEFKPCQADAQLSEPLSISAVSRFLQTKVNFFGNLELAWKSIPLSWKISHLPRRVSHQIFNLANTCSSIEQST